jgi:NitT/TauT family transport system substrate-binding protein
MLKMNGTRLTALVFAMAGVALVLHHTPAVAAGPQSVKLVLDWKPEPEFGGFYAAEQGGLFAKQQLNVNIRSAGEGAPTWQLVATGRADFATTAADQVLIARSQGADVVAIFAVYQTFPQGIMVHKARGFTRIDDVFHNPGTLEAEDDTWLHFCLQKFGKDGLKVTGYSGGIAAFLARPTCSQQCFITSEPILAKAQGGDPQTFLIAEAGYNPYTTVLITRGETLRNDPGLVKSMVTACRAGWRAYLDDPKPANAMMGRLNKDMDAAIFTAAAEAQKPLIETVETKKAGLGTMTAARWETLAKQLVDLKVIEKPIAAKECFVNADDLR